MIPAIIGVFILLTGASATAIVADNAKPGDVLYGVDRELENLRLSFAGDNSKNELKIKFAEERLEEVEELIDEASDDDAVESDDPDDDNASSSAESLDDDSDLDEEEVANVEIGLQHALDLLTELNAEKEGNPGLGTAIDRLLANMNSQIVALPGDIDVRFDSNDLETDESGSIGRTEIKLDIKKDGETKFETRMNGERVRIEIDEDGEMEIRVQDDRLDSGVRDESRLRVDDDEIEFESDSGFDTSGSNDEDEDEDEDDGDNAEDMLKNLEDAQKELEELQERADEDDSDDKDDSDSDSDSGDEEDGSSDSDGDDSDDSSGSDSDSDDDDA